jgi:hemerythrin-like domain-containing protein
MSKAIESLMHDHDAILSALDILERMTSPRPGEAKPTREDLAAFTGFLKEFADTCHHGKEEGILFPALGESGFPKESGPVAVMLSEHVEGRAFIRGMEQAMEKGTDLAAFGKAAAGYTLLLRGHIEKENNVLFPMAERALDGKRLEEIHRQFEEHEEKVIGHGRHEQLHDMLKAMKKKYPA